MNEPKHTPLPWRAGHDDRLHIDGLRMVIRAEEVDGQPYIAATVNESGIEATPEANAEFIVRACNAYYGLIEAAKTAKDVLIDNLGASESGDADLMPTIEFLEEAIAKAQQ